MTTTRDALLGGQIWLEQPARGEGYRVNADALLLAAFAGDARGVVFDLGAGVGAVGLAVCARSRPRRVVFVEVDPTSVVLARRNAEENGLGARAEVVRGDVLRVALARRGEAALVVCNPPYFEPGTARAPRTAATARVGPFVRFVRAARTLLGRRGRACFVYPARDLARALLTLREAGLEPKRLRMVHGGAGRPARVGLIEARAARPGGLVVEPPLFENDATCLERE